MSRKGFFTQNFPTTMKSQGQFLSLILCKIQGMLLFPYEETLKWYYFPLYIYYAIMKVSPTSLFPQKYQKSGLGRSSRRECEQTDTVGPVTFKFWGPHYNPHLFFWLDNISRRTRRVDLLSQSPHHCKGCTNADSKCKVHKAAWSNEKNTVSGVSGYRFESCLCCFLTV